MANGSGSLSERTANELYSMIVLQKTFAPGEKLPNENDLSQKLGVAPLSARILPPSTNTTWAR
jgi:DNA-binding FadR family transcriptional regulator